MSYSKRRNKTLFASKSITVYNPNVPSSQNQFKRLHELLIKPIADLLPKKDSDGVIFIPQESSIGFIRIISLIYLQENKIDSALEFGQQALVLAQSNQLRRQQMYSLNGLRQAYLNRVTNNKVKGNYQLGKSDATRSIEFSQQALTLARELKIRKAEADNLQQMGKAYGELKEYQLAIEALQQSASIARVIKDLDIESQVLTSLSSIYDYQGDNRKRIEVNFVKLVYRGGQGCPPHKICTLLIRETL